MRLLQQHQHQGLQFFGRSLASFFHPPCSNLVVSNCVWQLWCTMVVLPAKLARSLPRHALGHGIRWRAAALLCPPAYLLPSRCTAHSDSPPLPPCAVALRLAGAALQYVRIIYAYMGFAGFSIFFVLAGIIAIELLQTWHVHIDFISFTYILFNFAVS